MLKYLIASVMLMCAGCQTTTTGPESVKAGKPAVPASEKLLMRADILIDTYEVTVQHAVLKGADPSDRNQWGIMGSTRVSGYPGSWRSTPGLMELSDDVTKASYFLNGEKVDVAVRPGTHLLTKVLPDSQNSARIVGVFITATMTPAGLDICSMPFDVSATVGQIVVLYQKDAPVVP